MRTEPITDETNKVEVYMNQEQLEMVLLAGKIYMVMKHPKMFCLGMVVSSLNRR